jgi:hypothetical protein
MDAGETTTPACAGEVVGEGDVRLVEGEHDRQLVLGGDVVDRAHGRTGHRPGLAVPLDVGDHRLGVERGAIVELDALAQRHRPDGEVVVGLEGLREERLGLAVLVAVEQRVVEGPGHHPAGRRPGVRPGRPAGGLGLEAHGDRSPLHRVTGLVHGLVVVGGLTDRTLGVLCRGAGGDHKSHHQTSGHQSPPARSLEDPHQTPSRRSPATEPLHAKLRPC